MNKSREKIQICVYIQKRSLNGENREIYCQEIVKTRLYGIFLLFLLFPYNLKENNSIKHQNGKTFIFSCKEMFELYR